MARLPSYITRVDTGDGVRYEVRLHARRADGSRFQHKKRFKTPAEATEWYSKITAELASGTHTAPSNVTVREAVEQWLAAKCARVKPTTAAAYRFALAPLVERYGDVKAQRLTKLDAEALITELRTGSGERGVWARTTINPMLARWKTVWRDLHAQGERRVPRFGRRRGGARCPSCEGSAVEDTPEFPAEPCNRSLGSTRHPELTSARWSANDPAAGANR